MILNLERIQINHRLELTNEPEAITAEESATKPSDIVTIDDINLHTLGSELASSSSPKNQDVDRCDDVVD